MEKDSGNRKCQGWERGITGNSQNRMEKKWEERALGDMKRVFDRSDRNRFFPCGLCTLSELVPRASLNSAIALRTLRRD